jgi:predicted phage-related endonuclease
MAAIIGLSPWSTPLKVQQSKLNPVEDEEPSRLRLWLGLRLEPVIAELTAVRLGEKLRRPAHRYWHPTAPMHCELDFKVQGKPEHVECKVANFGEDWGPDGSQTIPRHYIPQVYAQLAVTGNVRAHVACLYHGQELRLYTFERDEGYIADLIEYATDWWDRHIVQRIPVPPLGDDVELIRRRHLRDNEQEVVATPEQAMLVDQLRLARQNKTQAERFENDLKVQVIDSMGTATKMVGPGFSVTYRETKPSTVTEWELVAKAYRGALEDAYAAGPMWDVGLGAPETLDAILSLYTATKAGSPRFVPTWKENGDA